MPLIVVGLGPGPRELLTGEALQAIHDADRVVLRTRIHPTVDALGLEAVESFDSLYDSATDFESLYATIVERLLELHANPRSIVYAVPGHPLVAEATVRELLRRAQPRPRVVAGISFLDSILGEAGIDPLEHNLLVSDALTPVVHPDSVAVYAQVYDQAIASNLKLRLLKAYPPEHAVIVTAYGREPTHVELAALDRQPHFDHLTSVIVPALPLEEAAGSFEGIHEVVRRLRAPDGCPWDREQTNRSITKYLIEECYEAIDALESGDMSTFASELGDVLLQVLLHAQIADDEGNFDITDVMSAIHRKLVRRHPHVFGDLAVSSAEEVVVNWDALKEQEREPDASVLSSVPAGMPALALAQGLQERAARYGFDWANRSDVVAKVMEEIGELQTAQTDADRYHEYGDVLFALINVARWDGVEAEEALRAAAARFRSRFAHIERRARETGVPLDQLGLEQMDRYWDEAKALERAQPG